jgi:hypothetical protein
MTSPMTALAIVFVSIGVLGLGALELWLFWLLGECSDRARREGAGVRELALDRSGSRLSTVDTFAPQGGRALPFSETIAR